MKPMKSKDLGQEITAGSVSFAGKFNNLGVIGSGSYGEVFKVQHKDTKQIYAIKRYKKIFTNRILALRTLRELMILRRINHPLIIKIYDILPPADINDYDSLSVVLEYLPFDLRKLCGKGQMLNDQHIPKIIYQLLKALKYLLSIKILHRDLKPQNILSDLDYNIKICDFGLARPGINEQTNFTSLSHNIDEKDPKKANYMTCHVVSRWYRAPELILMQTKYNESIEMWSVGCIMGELIADHHKNKVIAVNKTRKALFQGKACFPLSPPKKTEVGLYKLENGFPQSEDDQISKILQIIGSPTEQQVSFIQEDLAANYIKSLPKYQKKKAGQIFQYCQPEWEDFLQKALVFDPRKRMTVDEALNHPVFDKIKKQEVYKEEEPKQNEKDIDLSLPSDMPLEEIKLKLKEQIIYYRDAVYIKQQMMKKKQKPIEENATKP